MSQEIISEEAVQEVSAALYKLAEKHGFDALHCVCSRTEGKSTGFRWTGLGNTFARVGLCRRYVARDENTDAAQDSEEYDNLKGAGDEGGEQSLT